MLFGGKWVIQESSMWNFDVSWQGKVTMDRRGDEGEWMRAGSIAWLCQCPGTVMQCNDRSALQDKIVGVSGVSAFPILTTGSCGVVIPSHLLIKSVINSSTPFLLLGVMVLVWGRVIVVPMRSAGG